MKNFTSKELLGLFPNASARQYGPGQIVVYEGDQPAHVFFVTKGALKNYDIDDNGSEKILHVIGEASLFPMLYVFGDDEEVLSFYSTLDDTELLLIPLDDFIQRTAEDVAFANLILRWFVGEVDFIMDRIRGMEKTDGKAKVVQTLQYLIDRHSTPSAAGWRRVRFPLSQQILADLVGLTRETVSTIIKELDEAGIVRTRKLLHLEINQAKLAKAVASGTVSSSNA